MKREAAFSLVEIMCAILILGIGLVGLTEGIGTALASSKDAEIQSAAALLAAGQIETLRAEGFILEGETEGEGTGTMENYTWLQTVTTGELEGLYEVTIVVRHTESGSEIYELKTLLFDPPVIREETEEEENRNDRDRRRRT